MSELLVQAIQAIKANDRKNGKDMLLQFIQQDPENEIAWLWMIKVVDTDEERRLCLENVLTINTNNELAQKGLAILNKRQDENFNTPSKFADERGSKSKRNSYTPMIPEKTSPYLDDVEEAESFAEASPLKIKGPKRTRKQEEQGCGGVLSGLAGGFVSGGVITTVGVAILSFQFLLPALMPSNQSSSEALASGVYLAVSGVVGSFLYGGCFGIFSAIPFLGITAIIYKIMYGQWYIKRPFIIGLIGGIIGHIILQLPIYLEFL